MGRKEKILALAKGYRGRAKNCIRIATLRVQKGLQHAYVDRRKKRRDFRQLWIHSVNAGAREYGVPYSKFMHQLDKSNIKLNRKVLSEVAQTEPYSFRAIVEVIKRDMAINPTPLSGEQVQHSQNVSQQQQTQQ